MSFLLWIDEEADEAIDLGNPFDVFVAFGEMAKVSDKKEDWAELFSVPGMGEQQPEQEWLKAVAVQAKRFAEQYRSDLGDHARWILKKLAAPFQHKEAAPAGAPFPEIPSPPAPPPSHWRTDSSHFETNLPGTAPPSIALDTKSAGVSPA